MYFHGNFSINNYIWRPAIKYGITKMHSRLNLCHFGSNFESLVCYLTI